MTILCSTRMCPYYIKKMSRLYQLGTKNKTKNFWGDKNILFLFLGTKIKIQGRKTYLIQ